MRRLTLLTAVVATLAAAAPAAASPARQRLVFDAISNTTVSGVTAPRGTAEGGVLRDVAGHRLGTFRVACTAAERCTGAARTADGRLSFGGRGSATAPALSWRVTGAGGRYRRARGTLRLTVVSPTEWVAAATVTDPAVLRAGAVRPLGADRAFARRADGACTAASASLAALPPFPFAGFDPLRPDPALLPQVGAFFTGPGDPRPILHSLVARLQALGTPHAAAVWRHVLRAENGSIAVRDEQDEAALASDVPGFVKSVGDTVTAARRLALAASVFGAARCG